MTWKISVVAIGKIIQEFLYKIFESYFDGTIETEIMKPKIYEAIFEDSFINSYIKIAYRINLTLYISINTKDMKI